MNPENGGPINGVDGVTEGLSIRDYFAIRAPVEALDPEQSIKEAAAELGIKAEEYKCLIHYPLLLAKRAYAYADAMLAARNGQGVGRPCASPDCKGNAEYCYSCYRET